MTRKEQIRNAYKLTGGVSSFYDGMMTYSTLPGKAICRIVWNMDGEKNLRYLERALSGVPEDFSGKLLEVPVGTGVLTMPVYRELPEAEITCLDYSPDMMAAAQARAKAAGIGNVRFEQGDVGALPFEDESFDIVLSLNGFHAFPDKEAAYRETFRVLKKGGSFAIHDLMSPARYGDMNAFVKKLEAEGYEDLRLIDTADGRFMSRREAGWLGLGGSTLLVGRKQGRSS